jgi:hypothetical protein
MQAMDGRRINPELRELVVEACLALTLLDADRLEELAISCHALNRDLAGWTGNERAEARRQARDASREMGVFGCLLEQTRANLEVVNRVWERRCGGLEYSAGRGTGWGAWTPLEKCNGNH